MNNIWSKVRIDELGQDGIWLSPDRLSTANGRCRFTVRAFTSRPNEFKSSVIPDPVPEEFYSPWLDVNAPAIPSLVETDSGDYIIMTEDAADQGETSSMRVDMTGEGDVIDLVISRREGELFADGSALTPDGSVSGLWTPDADPRLYEIPHDEYQLTDVPCFIQITCLDLDYDNIKEVLVSKGNRRHALITEVWQYTGGEGAPFSFAGFAWGVETMRVMETSAISVPLGDLLGESIYVYEGGGLTMVAGSSFEDFKQTQAFEYGDLSNEEILDLPIF
jgi:hypothetical protein